MATTQSNSVNLRDIRSKIEKIDFFSGFSEEEKNYLCSNPAFFSQFKADTVVIHENDPERDLFVLIDGVALVLKEGEKEPIAILEQGAVFGEISFFARKRRSTSVQVVEDLVALHISEDIFMGLACPYQKMLMFRMVGLLICRLEKMNAVMERIQMIKLKQSLQQKT